jgi:hypothetical protein
MKMSAGIRDETLKRAVAIACVLFLGLRLAPGLCQATQVDITALTQETQRMSQKADEMTMVWWIPEEYWRVSFAQNPAVTEAQSEELLKTLRPYTVVVAVDGTIGSFGGVTYTPETTLRNSIQLVDEQGNAYRPLSDPEIDADTKNFLVMMKPALASVLGPIGQNMHFFVFPAKGKGGKQIADAKKEGAFSLRLAGKEFKWRLPLGSLLPPKTCPVDGEKLNGAWKFCPWHGSKLN